MKAHMHYTMMQLFLLLAHLPLRKKFNKSGVPGTCRNDHWLYFDLGEKRKAVPIYIISVNLHISRNEEIC